MLTPAQLIAATGCKPATADRFAEPLSKAIQVWGVTAVPEFLAQCAHESVLFTKLEESLYYTTPARIVAVFRKFDLDHDGVADEEEVEFAKGFVRQPEKLANYVYANRMGNRGPESGDGWRRRGRGLIHLTGTDNYARYELASMVPVMDNPDLLLQPQYAADSAAWFWVANDIDEFASDIVATTKKVNGGRNGLKERLALTERARAALA